MDSTQAQGQPSPAAPLSPSGTVALSAAEITRADRAYPDDQPKPDENQAPRQSQEPPKTPEQPQPKPDAAQPQEKRAGEEYQLQMPEGVQVDQEMLSFAVPVFKELGLTGEQASKLVPLVSQVQDRFNQSQMDAFMIVKRDWVASARTDREIGGGNWKETGRLAGVALDAGGAAAKDAREVLNESGLGNHPAMIRLFRRMGAEIERLQRQTGDSSRLSSVESARRSHQRSVYPNDAPKTEGAAG